MSESIEIYDKQDFVLAVYIGPFTVSGAARTIDQVLESIPATMSRPVLIDCRQMTGNLSFVDRFQTVVYGRKMVGRVSRLAIVRSMERKNADRFVETVAGNRGFRVQLFEDFDEAGSWLKS